MSQTEPRAARLQRESLVIDTCSQFGPSVYTAEMLARLDELVARDAPASSVVLELTEMLFEALARGEVPEFWDTWDATGVDAVSFTIGAFGDRPWSYEGAVRDLALWTDLFDAREDRLLKVLRASDLERAKREGRKGVVLAFQNATHIGDDLDNLDFFHRLGVRIIQLTYNSRNLLGDGCTERVQSGLSQFGVDAVKRMNELGIMVDTGHCSDATTLDAIEVSERPVAVSHAFSRSVSDHDRGKGDDVLRAIGERGGYFGIVVVPFFITDDPNPTLDHWLAHVDRAVELAGAEHVGIATDWGEELPKQLVDLLNEEMRKAGFGFREEHRVDWAATLDGYRSWRDWPNLTKALVERGFTDQEVRGFLGGNFLRVFSEAVG
jgi:membrane dipeptidase